MSSLFLSRCHQKLRVDMPVGGQLVPVLRAYGLRSATTLQSVMAMLRRCRV